MATTLKEAISREVARMNDADRNRVLAFARSLSAGVPSGVPGASLLRFAGIIPESEMTEIEAAIEEGCERVNPLGW